MLELSDYWYNWIDYTLMKKLFILLLLVVSACKNDNDDPSRSVFKVTMDSNVSIYNTQLWVILRDSENGELVDFKSIGPGLSLSFETNKQIPNDNLDVTFLSVDIQEVDGIIHNGYTAETYTAVQTGTEWTIKEPASGQSYTQSGTYNLSVVDVPNVYSLGLGDKYGQATSWSSHQGFIGGKVTLRENASTQIISVDAGSGPKYTFIDNLINNSSVSLSYNDLKTFDKTVRFQLPKLMELNAYVAAHEAYPGPTFYHYTSGGLPLYDNSFYSAFFVNGAYDIKRQSVDLPFLDKFSIYHIDLGVNGFRHLSFGPAPSSIEYIDPSVVTISDKSLAGISYTSTMPVLRRMTAYSYNDAFGSGPVRSFVTLRYYAGLDNTVFHQPIPSELIAQFSIPIEKVTYSSSTFWLTGDIYADYLKRDKTYLGGAFAAKPPFAEVSIYK